MRLRPKAKIDVLSGFLGSGKTTLLRNHLAVIDTSGVAVVINEYGVTAIDHRLVRYGDDDLRVLASGCACCAVADRLREVLLELLREDARKDGNQLTRIVLETSGLADPASILNTIRADQNLAEYLGIGSCVVTFDVVDGITCARTYPEVRHQLAGADSVVLTKADLAEQDAIERARSFVRDVNPLAQLHVAGAPDFDVAKVFEHTHGAIGISPHETPRHAGGIRSFCLRIEGEVDWASFSIWLTCLLNRHGSRILRFKGILESSSYIHPLVIHGVRHLVYPPQHLSQTGARRGYSDLVFIVDGLEPSQIDASLHRFQKFAAQHFDTPKGVIARRLETSEAT
ncbi:MAG: GTP-binding protein [Burkholderiales bacterium]|nr:GTP-binding protein [Burkholderiales bacterium]